MNIKLWYSNSMEQWRWTLMDENLDQMIDMAIQQGANPEDIDFEGTAEAQGVLV